MTYNASIDRINQLSIEADQHRAKPRFDPAAVQSNRGKLVDLSASGLAVRSRGAWGSKHEITTIELSSPNGRFTAQVEIMRIRRSGLFKTQTGCRFVDSEAVKRPLFDLFRERVGSGGGEFMARSAG